MSDKQLRKAKFSILLGATVALVQIGAYYLGSTEAGVIPAEFYEEGATEAWKMRTMDSNADGKYVYTGADGVKVGEYDQMLIENYPRGRIVMFGNGDQICNS